MAEEQQGGYYRVEVIASLFGVSVRRVQQLTQEGIISTVKTKMEPGTNSHRPSRGTSSTFQTSLRQKQV